MKTYLIVCHPEDRECIGVLVKSLIFSDAKRRAFAAACRTHGDRCSTPCYVDLALEVPSQTALDAKLLPFSGVFVNLALFAP